MSRIRAGDVAVVTGAASGIGFGLAEAFVQRGLAVVLADVEPGGLEAAAVRLKEMGGQALAVRTDVSRASDLHALRDRTLEHFGRVDIVCNNAGVSGHYAPSWTYDLQDWRWIIEVNLMGVIHGLQAFVPHLVAQNSGHVVNTASMAGLLSPANNGPYNAAKHAVVSLSETLSAELSEHAPEVGITVLCPALVRTRIFESERNRPASMTSASETKVSLPMPASEEVQRDVMEPSEVAAKVMDAIDANALYLLTHATSVPPLRAWAHDLLQAVS